MGSGADMEGIARSPVRPVMAPHYMTLIDDANELIENGFPVYREFPCLNPLLCEQSKGGGR